MTIDNVILKASHDLHTPQDAIDYAIRKIAGDIKKGKALQTVKITRFVRDGFDLSKFNFPICGNLSSADLMVIYAALGGFDTYVVGNDETGRRTDVIRQVLGLENIWFVPEIEPSIEALNTPEQRKRLTFTHTQQRGYNALPPELWGQLVLEAAADLPLLYDMHGHALELSKDNVDMAFNLNAINLMRQQVPSFVRNAYDRVVNSRGHDVIVKECNVFAQNLVSAAANENVFGTLYMNRNGGKYGRVLEFIKNGAPLKLLEKLARFLLRPDEIYKRLPELREYFRQRPNLGMAASYETLCSVMNFVFSPSVFRKRVFADATNDDIFSCWDVDGLNNDFPEYHMLFSRNFHDLGRIMPYAREVYIADDAMAKAEGVMTAERFRDVYNRAVGEIRTKMKDMSYLLRLGIDIETAFKIYEMPFDIEITEKGMHCGVHDSDIFLGEIEHYIKTHYLPLFEKHREEYRRAVGK